MVGRPPAPIGDGRDADRDGSFQAAEETNATPVDGPRGSIPSGRPIPPDATRTGAPDVAAIFDEIAPAYDRLSSILSLWRDGRWRAAVVEASGVRPGDAAIDVAAGTGKLAAALADRVGPFGRVVAVDLSPAMVGRGRAATRDIVQLEFSVGDAAALAFETGRFDAATIAFALRVMPDRGAVLAELRRVVRPGGRVVCLEPVRPRPRWWGRVYDGAVRRLAPLAVAAGGRGTAYRRLAGSVHDATDAAALLELMRGAGLVEVRHRGLWLGAVSLCVGTVPGD
jgi:demethylmenaquinone methyltransferase/2-methoxy-6-polyprenyl-1,4-benzoquinol methylase